jgi:hypothetical protein
MDLKLKKYVLITWTQITIHTCPRTMFVDGSFGEEQTKEKISMLAVQQYGV